MRNLSQNILFFSLTLLGMWPLQAVFSQKMVDLPKVCVNDATTSQAIIGAHLISIKTATGFTTNAKGCGVPDFNLAGDTLKVSALGYETFLWPANNLHPVNYISIQPIVLFLDEVEIESDALASNSLGDIGSQYVRGTEEVMQTLAGVDLVSRANFAAEPVIRGLAGGRVGLVLDGMKIYGACVDKMDPSSSYVESENLKKLSLSAGGSDLTMASQIGGTLNLVTQTATLGTGLQLSGSAGFDAVSLGRRIGITGNYGTKKWAFRVNYAYKSADDFSAGRRDGENFVMYNSGFNKYNVKTDAVYQINENQTLKAAWIQDLAWNIGYPVLLMDASTALANIYSLTHDWQIGERLSSQTKLYANRIDHDMNDCQRDVQRREVMGGMHMPMTGYTQTLGFRNVLSFNAEKWPTKLILDMHQLHAFADMAMYSIFENIADMYLLNIGDANLINAAVTLDMQRQFTPTFSSQFNLRFDFSDRDVEDETHQILLSSFYDNQPTAKQYFVPSASWRMVYQPTTQNKIAGALSATTRLPSHVENYGFYVYDYTDGYFYNGNPNLLPENSWQAEISWEHLRQTTGFKAMIYGNFIQNYILGRNSEGFGADTRQLRFRTFENSGDAFLAGGELSGLWVISPEWELAGSTTFTFGENLSLNEPLPMVPPLQGKASLTYESVKFWAELSVRGARHQERIAGLSTDEDFTPAWYVFNLRAGRRFEHFTVKTGIENILNRYYNEHLSIGNLPALGRNFYVSVQWRL